MIVGAVHERIVRVSDPTWELLQDIEQAYHDLFAAKKGSTDAEDAYTRLTMRKYELLQRIHLYERAQRIPTEPRTLYSPFPLPAPQRALRPAELDDADRQQRSPYRGE